MPANSVDDAQGAGKLASTSSVSASDSAYIQSAFIARVSSRCFTGRISQDRCLLTSTHGWFLHSPCLMASTRMSSRISGLGVQVSPLSESRAVHHQKQSDSITPSRDCGAAPAQSRPPILSGTAGSVCTREARRKTVASPLGAKAARCVFHKDPLRSVFVVSGAHGSAAFESLGAA